MLTSLLARMASRCVGNPHSLPAFDRDVFTSLTSLVLLLTGRFRLKNHEYEAATAFVEGLAHLQQSAVSVEEQTLSSIALCFFTLVK